HLGLHPLKFARNRPRLRNSIRSSGVIRPTGSVSRIHSRKAKSRQPLIAERKALRRHRGPRQDRSAFAVQPKDRGHASEFDLKRTCSRELKSSWHCLAIIDSV